MKMRIHLGFIFMLIGFVRVLRQVEAQSQEGFISLDCGLMPDDSPYNERQTGLTFISDAGFIDSGLRGEIKKDLQATFLKQTWNLRSFPEGKRNCFSLNVTTDTNYLIKATFVYGNYDGLDEYPSFDLHIGPNKWSSVDMNGKVNGTANEIIYVALSDHLQICLVKTGSTTPFISTLELRPLRNDTYRTQSGSLVKFFRVYLSNANGYIRFKDDVRDRAWYPYFQKDWSQISTTLDLNTTTNTYELPKDVMKTAAVPKNSSGPLAIEWTLNDPSTEMYVYMHFAEIEVLKPNETREFNINLNGAHSYGPLSPTNFRPQTLYDKVPEVCTGGSCLFEFVKTNRSTHPPLLNAIEIYTVVELQQSETDQIDVDAIKKIKAVYGLNRTSWQGDPCAPLEFVWDGLNCSYKSTSDPPTITSLQLSSSGLTGIISPYFQNLTQLKELDLSNNNLTGEVPEFLAKMGTLSVINFSNNKLNGSVPQALLDKQNDGSIKLILQGNPNLNCPSVACRTNGAVNKPKKNILVPVISSVAAFVVVMVVSALIFVARKKNATCKKDTLHILANSGSTSPWSSSAVSNGNGKFNRSPEPAIAQRNQRRFTYSEVQRMTNNFWRILGKGGFGVVYHGYLSDTEQVAVKMLSQSSVQGYKQFKAEVELLLRVHHKNLVGLVGYCDQGENLALVYEYMANGDLHEHLSGKRGSHVLSWGSRLKFAAEAAQGLEYLHNGCRPPMVHRDVKPTNILLNEHLQAKLADFGLSRSFPTESQSHVSTAIVGTPGYLDPEYYKTNWLTEKSDAYSFGVVLLEIFTNQLVIDRRRERPHISEWVSLMLSRGDIRNIMDPKLQGEYDSNAAWKAIELAMSCVHPSSSRRPNMTHVVKELHECLAAEKQRAGGSGITESTSSIELSLNFSTEIAPKAR